MSVPVEVVYTREKGYQEGAGIPRHTQVIPDIPPHGIPSIPPPEGTWEQAYPFRGQTHACGNITFPPA